jgi:hypothetical protein
MTEEIAEQQAYNTTYCKQKAGFRWVMLIMTEDQDKGHFISSLMGPMASYIQKASS